MKFSWLSFIVGFNCIVTCVSAVFHFQWFFQTQLKYFIPYLFFRQHGDHPSQVSGESDYYDYIEAQIEYEEDEGEPESLGTRYAVTPPQPRILKREKERQASASRGSHVKLSHKEYKETVGRRKSQPRSVLNVIKDGHLGDPTLCRLSGFDSDDNIDTESFREKREKRKRDTRESKKQTRSRDHDRFLKRMSDDFSGLDVGSMAQVPVNLESSGRFSHLMAKPVLALNTDNRLRRQCTEPAECPADRKDFCKTFGMLINLGTLAKREKEKKLASTKRQMSSELEQWKSQLMDFMWIELNAYLHGCSLEEEQTILRERREEVEKVLEDITNFQFRQQVPSGSFSDSAFCLDCGTAMGEDGTGCDSAASVSCVSRGECGGQTSVEGSGVVASGRTSDNTLNVQLQGDVSASFYDIVLTAVMVQLQQEALVQVQQLVDRLDACERLYPTMKQMASDFPLYGESDFTRRVKCLNLWLNITCDLCHKLKLFGRIIGAEQHGIEWPVINFDFPFPRHNDCDQTHRVSVPNIMEGCDDYDTDNVEEEQLDEEEEREDNAAVEADGRGVQQRFLSPSKQVKFTFGSDSAASSRDTSPSQRGTTSAVEPTSPVGSSTPNRNSRSSMGSFVTTLSRASSDISLDGVSHTQTPALIFFQLHLYVFPCLCCCSVNKFFHTCLRPSY